MRDLSSLDSLPPIAIISHLSRSESRTAGTSEFGLDHKEAVADPPSLHAWLRHAGRERGGESDLGTRANAHVPACTRRARLTRRVSSTVAMVRRVFPA